MRDRLKSRDTGESAVAQVKARKSLVCNWCEKAGHRTHRYRRRLSVFGCSGNNLQPGSWLLQSSSRLPCKPTTCNRPHGAIQTSEVYPEHSSLLAPLVFIPCGAKGHGIELGEPALVFHQHTNGPERWKGLEWRPKSGPQPLVKFKRAEGVQSLTVD